VGLQALEREEAGREARGGHWVSFALALIVAALGTTIVPLWIRPKA